MQKQTKAYADMTDVEKLIAFFELLDVEHYYNGRWLVAGKRSYRISDEGTILSVEGLVKPRKVIRSIN